MAIPDVKVCIWLPNGFSHRAGIGHAALKVMTPEGDKYYVTWLSSGSGCSRSGGSGGMSKSQGMEASKMLGFAQLRNRHTGQLEDNPNALDTHMVFDYTADRYANAGRMGVTGWGAQASANYKISIPVMTMPCVAPDDNLHGVNIYRIVTWWKGLLALPPGHPRRRYAALSTDQNCCGVVVRALLYGGLGRYEEPPCNLLYQGARTLLNWARTAAEKATAKNAAAAQMARHIQAQGPLTPEQRAIPSLDVWKRISYVGPFARRKDQVAVIDELIPKYHAADLRHDEGQKFTFLCRMHDAILSHLVEKPKSDRRPAVLFLGRIVRELIAENAAGFVPSDREPAMA